MDLEWGSSFGQCFVTYRSPQHENIKFTTNGEEQHRSQSYFKIGQKNQFLGHSQFPGEDERVSRHTRPDQGR